MGDVSTAHPAGTVTDAGFRWQGRWPSICNLQSQI